MDALEAVHQQSPIDIESYLGNLNLERRSPVYLRISFAKQLISILFPPVIVLLTFGIRFNALAKDELGRDSYSSSLVAAAYEANSLTLKLDQQLPVWKIWSTPMYLRYSSCMDMMHVEAADLLRRWERGTGAKCLMDDYARDPNLTKNGEGQKQLQVNENFRMIISVADLQGTAEDFLLAGTDTTSITTAMLLYHIARNPEVAERILTEVNSVMKPTEDPSAEIINSECSWVNRCTLSSMLTFQTDCRTQGQSSRSRFV